MFLLRLAVCYWLFYIAENNDVTSQKRFIQTNTDLLLTVTKDVQIGDDIFYWRFNNSKNIIRLNGDKINKPREYEHRVDFFPENLSLLLRNIQLSDSGMYTAVVSRDKEEILVTYDITVEDPVSPVQLSVDHVTNSSESCNFTVSCSSQISSISVSYSFTCDRHSCEEPRPLTPDHAPSLQVYQSNVLIVCNHSNHVSQENATKNYREICLKAESNDKPEPQSQAAIIGSVTAVGVAAGVGVVAGVIYVTQKRHQKERMEKEYEVPMEQSHEPCRPREETESPTSIYSEVQPHTGPAPIPRPAPRSTQVAESVYATVNKPSAVDAT